MIKLSHNDWLIENVDTVLFDKDGTIIDLHYFWGKITEMRVLAIISKYNLSEDLYNTLCFFLGYDVNKHMMLPEGITALYSRIKIIEIFTNNLIKLGVNATDIEIGQIFDSVSVEFYKKIQHYIKPIDGVIDFIKVLRSFNIKVGIVTSDSVESTNLTLKYYNWENLFDVVIGRESSDETKESGIPTKMALKVLGANSKNTLMIGDAPMDYISANNANIKNTILVSTGQIEYRELKKISNFVTVSLKDVKCLKI